MNDEGELLPENDAALVVETPQRERLPDIPPEVVVDYGAQILHLLEDPPSQATINMLNDLLKYWGAQRIGHN